MTKTYAVNRDLLVGYVNREVKKKMIMVYVIFGVFSMLFPVLTQFHPYSFFPVLVFVLLGFVCYLSIKNGTENLAQSLQVTFTESAIIKTHAKDSIDSLTKASMELNTIRYGQKFDCVIPFSKISFTEINDFEITIHSMESNLLSDSGIIKIPKEMSEYEEILEHVKSNKSRFKL
ncbi:MAG: hypothetical protein ACK4R1_01375 [Flavobacterium sp.]